MTDRSNLEPREITCFKAYDVRGELGKNLDADVAYRIGRAFAQARQAKRVVVGRDSRATSPELAAALIEGLTDGGADVLDLGLAGTFATTVPADSNAPHPRACPRQRRAMSAAHPATQPSWRGCSASPPLPRRRRRSRAATRPMVNRRS